MTRHQYGISALVCQTSFGGETSGSVAKCRLFSQAIRRVNDPIKCLVVQEFDRTKLFVERSLSVNRPLFQALRWFNTALLGRARNELGQDKQRAHNILNSPFRTVKALVSGHLRDAKRVSVTGAVYLRLVLVCGH